MKLAIALFVALAYGPAQGLAQSILGSELGSFSVLGASTVTNTGATTLTGNLGVGPGSAITGTATITVNGTNAATIGNPSVHQADAFTVSAQSQLSAAKTNLGLMGPGTLQPANLAGLTLFSGIYTVPAGVSNLTGTLTLDGQGNANAFWLFQVPSTLITSPGSVVDVINTGAGAGLYWNVGSSATLDTTTSFQGNILALTSISLNTGATIGCGRALASVGAVTMDTSTISTGCLGTGEEGSNGLSAASSVPVGGGTPPVTPPEGGGTPPTGGGTPPTGGGTPPIGGGTPPKGGGTSPIGSVPEPETYAITLAGLVLVGLLRRRRKGAAA